MSDATVEPTSTTRADGLRLDLCTIAGIPFDEVLALEGLTADGPEVVYLSGSLVSGVGNPWSDVDVFVIGERAPIGEYARHAPTNDVSTHYTHGRRVDFEFWRPERVRAIAERLGRIQIGGGEEINRTAFQWIEECFIDRIRIAVPLIGSQGVAEYRGLFDFDRFRAWQTQETLRHLDAQLDDLCGMMEIDDGDVALFTAREAVGTAVDAYLHHLGNTDPNSKWRAAYLARFGADAPGHADRVAEFWRLQFPDGTLLRADGAARRLYLEQCVTFANRIASWIQR